MNMIETASLIRGKALIDYAFSNNGHNIDLSVPDLIGMVAAYAGTGRYPVDIEKDLAKRLNPVIASRAVRTLELFNDWNGKSLWHQGPAVDDFFFTDKSLSKLYPGVRKAHRRVTDGNQALSDRHEAAC